MIVPPRCGARQGCSPPMPRFVSSFANRPLSAWVEDLQLAVSPDDRYRALQAVISLSSSDETVPWCRHALRDRDPGVRALAAKQLGETKRDAAIDVPSSTVW